MKIDQFAEAASLDEIVSEPDGPSFSNHHNATTTGSKQKTNL